ncbi:hypothetical protein B0O99DRAFT_642095 [Bisporella sp. PMI_857]|nr:hypothetical protein B0O99DRAFT_642095 [Bisporella sp. PMI_857]
MAAQISFRGKQMPSIMHRGIKQPGCLSIGQSHLVRPTECFTSEMPQEPRPYLLRIQLKQGSAAP